MTKVATILARVVLGALALAIAVALILFFCWWRLVTWPYRKLHPPKRGSKRAQLEAAGALLTSLAAFVVAIRSKPAPPPAKPKKKPKIVRVRGEVYTSPEEANAAADELEARLDELPAYGPQRERLAQHVDELRAAAAAAA